MATLDTTSSQTPEEEKNPILRNAQKAATSTVPGTKTPMKVETLPTMLDAIKQGVGVGTEYAREKVEAKGEVSDLNSRLATIVKETAQDRLLIDQQKRQETMKAERAAQEAFEAGGGVGNLKELQESRLIAQKAALEAQKEKEALVTEEGLGGAIKRFLFLEGVEEDAAVTKETLAMYNRAIQNTTRNANDIATTVDNMKLSETDATLAANARVFLKQATADAIAFELKAAESHAEAAQTALSMTDRNINLRLKQYDLIQQDIDREDLRAARRLQREQIAKTAEFEDTFVRVVRKGRKDSGLPYADPEDPAAMERERQEILAARKTKGAAATAVNEAFDIGARITRPTYYQTMLSKLRVAPKTLTDGKNKSLTFFKSKTDEALTQLQAARAEAGIKTKLDEATLSEAVNNYLGAEFKKAEAEIVSTDLDNPYHAPPLGELIKTTPELQKHKFIAEELLPLFSDPEAPVEDLDIEKVLELAVGNIKTKTHPERKYTFNEVDQALGALYKRAAVYNTESQGLDINSFPIQTTYNAKLKGINAFKFSPFSFGGFELEVRDNIVNIIDGVQRRKLLLRMLSGTEKGISDIGPDLFKGLIGIESKPEELLPEGAK